MSPPTGGERSWHDRRIAETAALLSDRLDEGASVDATPGLFQALLRGYDRSDAAGSNLIDVVEYRAHARAQFRRDPLVVAQEVAAQRGRGLDALDFSLEDEGDQADPLRELLLGGGHRSPARARAASPPAQSPAAAPAAAEPPVQPPLQPVRTAAPAGLPAPATAAAEQVVVGVPVLGRPIAAAPQPLPAVQPGAMEASFIEQGLRAAAQRQPQPPQPQQPAHPQPPQPQPQPAQAVVTSAQAQPAGASTAVRAPAEAPAAAPAPEHNGHTARPQPRDTLTGNPMQQPPVRRQQSAGLISWEKRAPAARPTAVPAPAPARPAPAVPPAEPAKGRHEPPAPAAAGHAGHAPAAAAAAAAPASPVTPASAGPPAPPPVQEGDGCDYVGIVKSFSADSGYGFIKCELLEERFGGWDVWTHWRQLPDDCQVPGVQVVFQYCLGKDHRPQARMVRRWTPELQAQLKDESHPVFIPPTDEEQAAAAAAEDGPDAETREDPTRPAGSERFCRADFFKFYGKDRGQRYWDRALLGKYPQRPEPAVFASCRVLGNERGRETLVGDYKIEQVIGEGTFSTVRSGFHTHTRRDVAIKCIRKVTQQGKAKREESEVLWETALMRELSSEDNVVRLIDAIESPEAWYLVLEPVKGGDLTHRMKQSEGKRLSEADAKHFFRHLCAGVNACHTRGIAHRDIRPENCLITHDNVLKLTDFGVSSWHRDPELDEVLDIKVGTVHYCAPEVLEGKYNAFLADCYSVGCVLFEALAGVGQFAYGQRGQQEADVEDVLRKGKLNRCPPHVSPMARDLLHKLLRREPYQRLRMDQARTEPFATSEMGHVPARLPAGAANGRRMSVGPEDEEGTKRRNSLRGGMSLNRGRGRGGTAGALAAGGRPGEPLRRNSSGYFSGPFPRRRGGA
eukprot:TRINITY_DN3408_c1_g3_i1.p1 TRINITY_DN3408_c1_g3~~TRINITY_DN3408_c1_g3_i1.p1  ORF type:complete len:906 (+),score=243.66 TRINITY_DN3408_c1_g3_i1:86-2803(+)